MQPVGPMHQGGILQAALRAVAARDEAAMRQHGTWCALLTGRSFEEMIKSLEWLLVRGSSFGAPQAPAWCPLDEQLDPSDAWRLGAAAQWTLRTSAAALTGREPHAFRVGPLPDIAVLVASIARHGALEGLTARGWFDLTRRFVQMAGVERVRSADTGSYDLAAIAFSLVPHEERVLRIGAAVALGGDYAAALRPLRELAAEVAALNPAPANGRLWLDALLGGA